MNGGAFDAELLAKLVLFESLVQFTGWREYDHAKIRKQYETERSRTDWLPTQRRD